jgi:hypothetical protein
VTGFEISRKTRGSLVGLIRLLLLICISMIFSHPASAQGAQAANQGANSRKPANFAMLVDTSGSMVGLYQRRDPRPTLVLELVQSLITETMSRGDRLVVLPFNHVVHNTPGEFLSLSSLNPGTALREVESLNLQPRSGVGTMRTAALGAGVRALQALVQPANSFDGGIIFVITDTDNDTKPTGSPALADYNKALSLQGQGDLTLLSRIPQGGIRLEVWRVKGLPGMPVPPNPASAIAKVKRLLKDIIPRNLPSSGPVAADFQQGGLGLKADGEWKAIENKNLAFELPVVLTSRYRALHFKGTVDPKARIVDAGKKTASGVTAQLTFSPSEITLAPGASQKGLLRISGLQRPSLWSLGTQQYTVQSSPTAKGTVTTAPRLFKVSDPRATARVSQVLWVESSQPTVQLGNKLPDLPLLSANRVWQALGAILLLAALAFGAKAVLPKPVPRLIVHYRLNGPGGTKTAILNRADDSAPLSRVQASVQRQGREQAIIVTPTGQAQLLDASQNVQSQMVFSSAGRFLVRDADGRLSAVHLNFSGEALAEPQIPQAEETSRQEESDVPPLTQDSYLAPGTEDNDTKWNV